MELSPLWRCLALARRLPRLPTLSQPTERQLLVQMLANHTRLPSWLSLDRCDWAGLFRLAHRFALIPALAERSSVAEWGRSIPGHVAGELRERLERTLIQNRMLFEDARRVAAELDRASITHQFMKGMAIIAHKQGQPQARHTDDIDVLIADTDLARTEEILTASGWIKRHIPPHPTHPLVMDSPAGSMLEVHIHLRAPFEEDVRRDSVRVSIEGTPLSVTRESTLVRHLCHHALIQHEADPRYLPRHIVDLQCLSRPASLDEAGRLSYEALQLVESCADDPTVSHALGALLFPTHHTAVHHAVDNTRRSGFRGLRRELAGLARLPDYLVREIQ